MKSISAAIIVLAGVAWYFVAEHRPHEVHNNIVVVPQAVGTIRFWSIVLGIAGAVAWILFSFVPSRFMRWMERDA